MLNYEFPPLGGGASPVSYELAKGYVGLGHKVDVVTMGYRDLPRYEQIDGINIYRVPCLRSKKEICHPWEQLTYIFSAKHFLKKHLQTNSYDINHTHFIIPTGIISLWLKKKFGLPYIITSHGSDVPGFNPDRFVLLHKFTGPVLKRVCDNAKFIVALSDYLKKLIKKNIHPYDNNKLIKIPNGIDPSKFTPQNKEKIILSTGRLLPRKGFQHLIKAVSEQDIGYEVHICGDGPMMQELKDLASLSKTKIVFHGWLDNQSSEYKDLIEKAAIYCLISSNENSSVALLEAMSAGCAVIASNISGCPETVGASGILVEPGSKAHLQNQLVPLTNDFEQVIKMGRKARDRVLKSFHWNIIVGKYAQIL